MILWHRGDPKFQLSENFLSTEFQCKCGVCEVQMISSELVSKLQILRDKIGTPIKITSGYRCADYQKLLKSQGLETAAKKSMHEQGKAADMVVPADKTRFMWFVEMLFKSIGDGGNWIHVDLRKDKTRRWGYQSRGGQDARGTTN